MDKKIIGGSIVAVVAVGFGVYKYFTRKKAAPVAKPIEIKPEPAKEQPTPPTTPVVVMTEEQADKLAKDIESEVGKIIGAINDGLYTCLKDFDKLLEKSEKEVKEGLADVVVAETTPVVAETTPVVAETTPVDAEITLNTAATIEQIDGVEAVDLKKATEADVKALCETDAPEDCAPETDEIEAVDGQQIVVENQTTTDTVENQTVEHKTGCPDEPDAKRLSRRERRKLEQQRINDMKAKG